MFIILLCLGCLFHTRPRIEYTRIGVVDRHDNGVCVVEIHRKEAQEYVTILVKSNNCKDGDIIAIGRRK